MKYRKLGREFPQIAVSQGPGIPEHVPDNPTPAPELPGAPWSAGASGARNVIGILDFWHRYRVAGAMFYGTDGDFRPTSWAMPYIIPIFRDPLGTISSLRTPIYSPTWPGKW